MEALVQGTKDSLDLFTDGNISLEGEYPDIPQEVYDVFYGMVNGIIEKHDIQTELAGIEGMIEWSLAHGVDETWGSMIPTQYRLIWQIYVYGWFLLKANKIFDIIGDTKIFNLPEISTPNMLDQKFMLNKEGLDGIMKDLKKQLSDLWPDDEPEKKKKDQSKQTEKISKLEKEIQGIYTFINNPIEAFENDTIGKLNNTLERIDKLRKKFDKFNDKLSEAAKRLGNLDLPSLAELNESIFLEKINGLEDAVPPACYAMTGTYYTESKLEETSAFEKGRMKTLTIGLNFLKKNPKPLVDYVNSEVRKKDIEALKIAIDNQKHIDELSKISIEYDKSKESLIDFGNIAKILAMFSYNQYRTLLESDRICNAIRIFDKMKEVDDGLGDIVLRAVSKYVKGTFPTMYSAEQSTFVNAIVKGGTSVMDLLKGGGLDKLNSLASDITTETKGIIDKTKKAKSGKINSGSI